LTQLVIIIFEKRFVFYLLSITQRIKRSKLRLFTHKVAIIEKMRNAFYENCRFQVHTLIFSCAHHNLRYIDFHLEIEMETTRFRTTNFFYLRVFKLKIKANRVEPQVKAIRISIYGY